MMNRTPIIDNFPKLKMLTPYPSSWERVENGYTAHIAWAQSVYISDAELGEMDPRLPPSLLLLVDDTNRINCEVILQMLDLWDMRYRFKTLGGLHVTFSEITDIAFSRDIVLFEGSGQYFKESVDALTGLTLHIPSMEHAEKVWVKQEWLESEFPGWTARYDLSVELDSTIAERVDAIFSYGKPEKTYELPNDFAP